MKRILIIAIAISITLTSVVYTQSIKEAIDVLDVGIKAYQNEETDKAAKNFKDAVAKFDKLLEGVQSPEDAAYSKYYRATALYYLGRLQDQSSKFEDASAGFKQAVKELVGIDLYGAEYVRSKYLRALSSFRQFQLSRTTNKKKLYLEDAIGDFQGFLNDSVIVNSEQFTDLKENVTFLLGFSYFKIGEYESYKKATYTDAKGGLQEAIKYFKKLEKAQNSKLSAAAKFYEGESHYRIARLYMRVTEDKWDNDLSSKSRNVAISDALKESRKKLENAAEKASSFESLATNNEINNIVNKVFMAGVGNKKYLNEAQSKLVEMRDTPDWKNQILLNIAYTQLIKFLLFKNSPRTVTRSFNKVKSFTPVAYFWSGWVRFINGNYEQAIVNFNKFNSKIPGREYKWKKRQADAKFRLAESYFWKGSKANNQGNLKKADRIFKALKDPKGQYYEYLTENQAAIANTRSFLIGIESTLGESAEVNQLQTVMEVEGLTLPDNAQDYVEVGKYFLRKGIETAKAERENALKFAREVFNLIIEANVSNELKNKAKFLKGVTLVKFSTVQDKSEKSSTLEEARGILEQCTGVYEDEAQYVKGISYFIVNDYSQASSLFNSLKVRGHLRATYYYGLTEQNSNCPRAGKALKKVVATIKDRTDPLYLSASNAISNLDCQGSIGKADPFESPLEKPPMTYENLVDPEAEKDRKKRAALAVWQKVAKDKQMYPVKKLIKDKPPETNVEIKFKISPADGGEVLSIDGDSDVAREVEDKYSAEVTRGKHKIAVQKKGFYLWKDEISVSKSKEYTIELSKAVRYSTANQIPEVTASSDIYSLKKDFFVTDNKKDRIIRYSKKGVKVSEIDMRDLSIGYCSGIALDGDKLLIADSRKNQLVRCDLDGENKEIIAYGNEKYGKKSPVKISDVYVDEDNYYVVDNGNSRVMVFEGTTFRRAFGAEHLSKPFDIAISSVDENIYVTDWGKGAIEVFNETGDFQKEITLEDQGYPTRILVNEYGYFYVTDFISNKVIKYNPSFKKVGEAEADFVGPKGVTVMGEGPSATLFISDKSKVYIFKGSWDNAYMPE